MRGHQEYEEECTQHLHAALKSEVVKQVHETKEHEDARATLPEDRPTTLSVIKRKSGNHEFVREQRADEVQEHAKWDCVEQDLQAMNAEQKRRQ